MCVLLPWYCGVLLCSQHRMSSVHQQQQWATRVSSPPTYLAITLVSAAAGAASASSKGLQCLLGAGGPMENHCYWHTAEQCHIQYGLDICCSGCKQETHLPTC